MIFTVRITRCLNSHSLQLVWLAHHFFSSCMAYVIQSFLVVVVVVVIVSFLVSILIRCHCSLLVGGGLFSRIHVNCFALFITKFLFFSSCWQSRNNEFSLVIMIINIWLLLSKLFLPWTIIFSMVCRYLVQPRLSLLANLATTPIQKNYLLYFLYKLWNLLHNISNQASFFFYFIDYIITKSW